MARQIEGIISRGHLSQNAPSRFRVRPRFLKLNKFFVGVENQRKYNCEILRLSWACDNEHEAECKRNVKATEGIRPGQRT